MSHLLIKMMGKDKPEKEEEGKDDEYSEQAVDDSLQEVWDAVKEDKPDDFKAALRNAVEIMLATPPGGESEE